LPPIATVHLETLHQKLDDVKRLTLIFCILFLHFWQIFQLNRFALEDGPFHIFNHLFLLLPELVIPELHPVDFLAHRYDFGLANLGVEGVLHLFFKLDFAFPQENLPFSLDDFS